MSRLGDMAQRKLSGGALGADEMKAVAEAAEAGEDLSALLGAMVACGLDDEEAMALCGALLSAGPVVERVSDIRGVAVTQVSTGGVGDKCPLILGPLMAAMNVLSPMISGPAMAHTGSVGGRLSCLGGMRLSLSPGEFVQALGHAGCAMAEAGPGLLSALGRLEAEAGRAIARVAGSDARPGPLLAALAMTRAIGAGARGVVADIKCGAGSLVPDPQEARLMGATMISLARSRGIHCIAVLTNNGQPLGRTVGRALELKEALTAMKGRGGLTDMMDLTYTLAAWMLYMADCLSEDHPPKGMNKFEVMRYRREIMDFVEKGDTFKRFIEMVDAQGGDTEAAFGMAGLGTAPIVRVIEAPEDGYIMRLEADAVGRAALLLGAEADPLAGVVLSQKVGASVRKGDPLCMLHMSEEAGYEAARAEFLRGLCIGDRDPAQYPIVLDVAVGAATGRGPGPL